MKVRPRQRVTRPRQSATRPRQRATRPRQRATRPRQSATRPRQRATRPRQRPTRPRQRATRPRQRVRDGPSRRARAPRLRSPRLRLRSVTTPSVTPLGYGVQRANTGSPGGLQYSEDYRTPLSNIHRLHDNASRGGLQNDRAKHERSWSRSTESWERDWLRGCVARPA